MYLFCFQSKKIECDWKKICDVDDRYETPTLITLQRLGPNPNLTISQIKPKLLFHPNTNCFLTQITPYV